MAMPLMRSIQGDGLGLRNQRNWTLTSQSDDADLLLFSLA